MPTEPDTTVARLFDSVAGTYDAVGVEMFKPIGERLVALLAPQRGEQALDLGCGRGAALFPLAEAVGTAGAVSALDVSPAMIEMTAADAADAGLDIDFHVGDALSPDLGDRRFDVVTASLLLFFLADPAAALGRWRSLLVDGGRLGVSTFGPYDSAWQEVDAVIRPYLPAQALDPRAQAEDSPFASDTGMERLLTEAGLGEVRTATAVIPVRFADADQWYRWSWSVGQRRMWEAIPEGERDAVRALASGRVERCRDAQGRIGFDQTVRFTLGVR